MKPGKKPQPPRAVIVHGIGHARAAACAARDLAVPVTLRSAPGAAGYAGALWFRELIAIVRAEFPDVSIEASLDCADQAGYALGALRQGIGVIRFNGRKKVADKIAAIVTAHGATLDTDRRPALDLDGIADPEAACRDWLS